MPIPLYRSRPAVACVFPKGQAGRPAKLARELENWQTRKGRNFTQREISGKLAIDKTQNSPKLLGSVRN